MITSLNNNSMIDRALPMKTASDNVRDRRRTDADTNDAMSLSKTAFIYVQIVTINTDSKISMSMPMSMSILTPMSTSNQYIMIDIWIHVDSKQRLLHKNRLFTRKTTIHCLRIVFSQNHTSTQ